MTIEELQEICHSTAKSKGWWDGINHNIPEKLCLIHSEISEALEEFRGLVGDFGPNHIRIDAGKPCGFSVELADAIIRILDLCGFLKINIEGVLVMKSEFNKKRPYRHGGKRC